MIILESFQRLYDPPGVDAQRLLPISIAGLIVNIVGVYTFRANNRSPHTNSYNIKGALHESILLVKYESFFVEKSFTCL